MDGGSTLCTAGYASITTLLRIRMQAAGINTQVLEGGVVYGESEPRCLPRWPVKLCLTCQRD